MTEPANEPEPILTIYKAEDFTAQILTDERGIVLDLQILSFKPSSEFARRIAQRRKYYRQPMRGELPEDNLSNAAGAWL
jgi:hypothetical protein